jgi:hypothetical protein
LAFIVTVAKPNTVDGERRSVQTHLYRIPDPNMVPIYPNSEALGVHHEVTSGGWKERLTTFVTSDEPSKVEAYYRGLLPQYGWSQQEEIEEDTAKGLVYEYEIGSGPYFRRARLHISSGTHEGRTRVQLRVEGTDVRFYR